MLRAVATDGHRLARMEMPLPEGAAGMPGVIVPRKTVTELRKLLDEIGPGRRRSRSPTPRSASPSATTVLTSKLIDGTFPDYDRVIPTGNDKILEVSCKEFAEAVDRVSTISTEKSRAVKLALERGSLTLSATSPENGTASEEIEVRYTAAPHRDRLQLALSAGHRRADRGRGRALRMADAASPTVVRDAADAQRALRAHADARLRARQPVPPCAQHALRPALANAGDRSGEPT